MASRFLVVPVVLVVALAGCDTSAPRNGGRVAEPEADRFDGCPSGSESVVRGRVLVPDPPGEGDADDGRIRRERPASGLRVEVYRTDSKQQRIGEATTDAEGRWCTGVPEEAFGPTLVARTTWEGVKLRRSLVAPRGQHLSVRSEALHRALLRQLGGLDSLSRAAYLNLLAVASSAVDLVEPVSRRTGESAEAYLKRLEGSLENSERFRRHFQRIKKGLSD